MLGSVSVSDAFVSTRRPWLYAIYAPQWSALYLGQSSGREGALGRLAQHLSTGDMCTFRRRLCERYEYELESLSIGTVLLWCQSLGEEYGPFTSEDYREAVEYLVQQKLLNKVAEMPLRGRVGIVSNVESNAYTRDVRVISAAEMISLKLEQWLLQQSPRH